DRSVVHTRTLPPGPNTLGPPRRPRRLWRCPSRPAASRLRTTPHVGEFVRAVVDQRGRHRHIGAEVSVEVDPLCLAHLFSARPPTRLTWPRFRLPLRRARRRHQCAGHRDPGPCSSHGGCDCPGGQTVARIPDRGRLYRFRKAFSGSPPTLRHAAGSIELLTTDQPRRSPIFLAPEPNHLGTASVPSHVSTRRGKTGGGTMIY